jgi:hypothetical protein
MDPVSFRMKRVLVLLKHVLFALVFAGCSKASDSTTGKQMPKLPPPPHVQPVAGLRVSVEIAGNPAPAIDAARLSSLKPDFEDSERRAWRMTTLLGPIDEKTVVSVTGENDVTVQFRRATGDKEPQPSLLLTRRGELVALLVDPADPFPSYHGQGRRLGRPGDPMPRIAGVKKISVRNE